MHVGIQGVGQECVEVVCAKGQWVRLVDVFVIGPLMLWGGYKLVTHKHRVAGASLAVFGAATIGYNAKNYLDTAAARRVALQVA
jgi:hypothetical protein